MKLVLPDKRLKDIFTVAALDYKEHNEWHYYEKHKGIVEDCDNFFEELQKQRDGIDIGDRVATTNYWLVDDSETEVRGIIRIRHVAIPIHGNIGYDVPPKMRFKGYGRELLRLGLIKAREHGISDVLVTCGAGNKGSKGIIEENGGRYLKSSMDNFERFDQYIIEG